MTHPIMAAHAPQINALLGGHEAVPGPSPDTWDEMREKCDCPGSGRDRWRLHLSKDFNWVVATCAHCGHRYLPLCGDIL